MNQKLVFAQSSGSISTISLDIDNIEEQKQEEVVKVKKRSDGKKLTTMLHRIKSQFLCLGQFLPQIFDIENSKCTWRGKNVPNDQDDLEVPTYDTSGQFLPKSDRTFVISNGFGKIRLYDIWVKARPVIDYQSCDYYLSKIKATECGNYVIYASQKGELTKADIRMDFKTVHWFKGSKGTIKDIAVASDFVACVGLDRFLRIYDHETKESMANIYLKQKQNSILIDKSTAQEYTTSVYEKRQEIKEKEDDMHEYYWENFNGKQKKRNRNKDDDLIGKSKMFKFKE